MCALEVIRRRDHAYPRHNDFKPPYRTFIEFEMTLILHKYYLGECERENVSYDLDISNWMELSEGPFEDNIPRPLVSGRNFGEILAYQRMRDIFYASADRKHQRHDVGFIAIVDKLALKKFLDRCKEYNADPEDELKIFFKARSCVTATVQDPWNAPTPANS